MITELRTCQDRSVWKVRICIRGNMDKYEVRPLSFNSHSPAKQEAEQTLQSVVSHSKETLPSSEVSFENSGLKY